MDEPPNTMTIAPPAAEAFENVQSFSDSIDLVSQIKENQLGGLVGPAVVDVARGQLGVCESGTNGGIPQQRYVQAFWPGHGPEPWCAFFVSWCFLQVTGHAPPWSNPGYVPSVHSWAVGAGRVVSQPVHGDIFGVGDGHMGLVVGADQGRQTIWTVEGNTSSGCVKDNLRPWGGLWFARL